jgi:hypothetical protein
MDLRGQCKSFQGAIEIRPHPCQYPIRRGLGPHRPISNEKVLRLADDVRGS